MLTLSPKHIEEIYTQGEEEQPNEACGYLAGRDGVVLRRFPMTNVDQSREHFTLDPQEQFKVLNEVRSLDLQLLAVYHTHPETPARPSQEDIRLAYDPEMIYVIASLVPGKREIKAFSIVEGEVSHVQIKEADHA